MNKRNVFLWTLYDFANSIAVIVFFLYFSQWFVIEKGFSDLSFNLIFAIGSVLLLLTAPILGSIADKNRKQQTYLNYITVILFIFFLLASLTALFFPDKVYISALFFLLANYFYQFSFIFYNALLRYIAPKEKWGLISGIGQAGNWLGQITGLLIALPFASGAIYLFGAIGRSQTFLPAVLMFGLLALPMLLLFKLDISSDTIKPIGIVDEYRKQWSQFKELLKIPDLKLFLISYFFFNDAIITAANNFPIFMQNVFNVSDGTKSLILLGILGTSVIGALASGWCADRIGLKKTLLIVIGSWIILLPALSFSTYFPVFAVCTVILGFLFGSISTVTRAVMTTLTPPEKLNFAFSFYTIAERTATFVGPITWGIIVMVFMHIGVNRYRIALISMTLFVILGLYFAQKINNKAFY